jgi:hypothetical protein
VKNWQQVNQNGKVMYAPYFEDGTAGEPVPYEVAEKLEFRNTGKTTDAINPYTGQIVSRIQNTMSPEAAASNALGWANNRLSQQRLVMDRANQNQPQFNAELGGFVTKPTAASPQGTFTPLAGITKPEKPLTEVQAKATTFASRMKDADKIISEYDGKVSPAAVRAASGVMPDWIPGSSVANAAANTAIGAVSPETQKYRQAQENWVTANLRLESGAAIGKDEKDAEIAKWFPVPGDSKDVITQKAAARKVAERALAAQAGPGASKIDGIVDGPAANVNTGLPSGWSVKER